VVCGSCGGCPDEFALERRLWGCCRVVGMSSLKTEMSAVR
jgi:hypothetical protein